MLLTFILNVQNETDALTLFCWVLYSPQSRSFLTLYAPLLTQTLLFIKKLSVASRIEWKLLPDYKLAETNNFYNVLIEKLFLNYQ